MPGICHQIGVVYYVQQEWEPALLNYQQALDWQQQLGDFFNRGGTFHQIGMLYEAQQHWELALDSYRQAVDWQKRVGNESNTGSTYHQLGLVYLQQQEWTLALDNFQQALSWKQRTGNEYSTATTSQLIGRIYATQQLYAEAIIWLKRSATCLSKYGHPLANEAKEFLSLIIRKQQAQKRKKVNTDSGLKNTRKKRIRIVATPDSASRCPVPPTSPASGWQSLPELSRANAGQPLAGTERSPAPPGG